MCVGVFSDTNVTYERHRFLHCVVYTGDLVKYVNISKMWILHVGHLK